MMAPSDILHNNTNIVNIIFNCLQSFSHSHSMATLTDAIFLTPRFLRMFNTMAPSDFPHDHAIITDACPMILTSPLDKFPHSHLMTTATGTVFSPPLFLWVLETIVPFISPSNTVIAANVPPNVPYPTPVKISPLMHNSHTKSCCLVNIPIFMGAGQDIANHFSLQHHHHHRYSFFISNLMSFFILLVCSSLCTMHCYSSVVYLNLCTCIKVNG